MPSVTEDGDKSPAPRVPARAVNVALAVLLVGLFVAFGASWVSARSRGKAGSKALYSTAVELSECVSAALGDATTVREALELSPADATPLAGCATLAERAQAQLRELASLRFPRDKQGLRELGAIAEALAEARFRERADTLAAGEVESLDSGVGALLKGACRIALGEGSLEVGACPPPPRSVPARALPSARLVLDAPAEFLLKVAFSFGASPDGALELRFAMRERDSETIALRLGRSTDAGATFSFWSGRAGKAVGLPDVPAVSFSGGAPRLVLVTQRDDKGAYQSAWIAPVSAERIDPAFEVPALPEGLEPLRAGTPLWPAQDPKQPGTMLAIGPRDPARVGGALVRLRSDGKLELLPTPAGTLLAATTAPKPRLLLAEPGALALYEVPAAGDKWPSPHRVPLPDGALLAEPAAEASCGVAGEKLFPLAARGPSHAAFVAIGDPRLFALRLEAPEQSELGPLCGTCPPGLLARSDERLSLVIPVGSRMTELPVGAPLLVTGARAAKRSVATCSDDVVLVAHVAQGRVWAQTTRAGSWQLGRPSLLAAPNEHGTPVDVRVASAGGKLFVLWRRDRRMQLHVEMLASDDGGVSWR